MFIRYPEGIQGMGIIAEEFLKEYLILLVNSMYSNLYAALLWLRLLAKCLIKGFYMTRIQAEIAIYNK